jgi:hypothetical protein
LANWPIPDLTALGVRERILLFCIGTGTDWQRAGVTSETVTALVVNGLLQRDALGALWRVGATDQVEGMLWVD